MIAQLMSGIYFVAQQINNYFTRKPNIFTALSERLELFQGFKSWIIILSYIVLMFGSTVLIARFKNAESNFLRQTK